MERICTCGVSDVSTPRTGEDRPNTTINLIIDAHYQKPQVIEGVLHFPSHAGGVAVRGTRARKRDTIMRSMILRGGGSSEA